MTPTTSLPRYAINTARLPKYTITTASEGIAPINSSYGPMAHKDRWLFAPNELCQYDNPSVRASPDNSKCYCIARRLRRVGGNMKQPWTPDGVSAAWRGLNSATYTGVDVTFEPSPGFHDTEMGKPDIATLYNANGGLAAVTSAIYSNNPQFPNKWRTEMQGMFLSDKLLNMNDRAFNAIIGNTNRFSSASVEGLRISNSRSAAVYTSANKISGQWVNKLYLFITEAVSGKIYYNNVTQECVVEDNYSSDESNSNPWIASWGRFPSSPISSSMDDSNCFVVAYLSTSLSSGEKSVKFAAFDCNGGNIYANQNSLHTVSLKVNQSPCGDARPVVAALEDGFVVVWSNEQGKAFYRWFSRPTVSPPWNVVSSGENELASSGAGICDPFVASCARLEPYGQPGEASTTFAVSWHRKQPDSTYLPSYRIFNKMSGYITPAPICSEIKLSDLCSRREDGFVRSALYWREGGSRAAEFVWPARGEGLIEQQRVGIRVATINI